MTRTVCASWSTRRCASRRCELVPWYQNYVFAILHDSTIASQLGTIFRHAQPPQDEQSNGGLAIFKEWNRLQQMNTLTPVICTDMLHSVSFGRWLNDCKQPGYTMYRKVRPQSYVKLTFANQNWWHTVGCQKIPLLPHPPSALNNSFMAKTKWAAVAYLQICTVS